ncbi:MAG: hypothetical protein E6Q83_19740 [Thiothrix sp.]|nr:MAG: hypothetical protein E6Q83_19740 [Thiothrix sp.]
MAKYAKIPIIILGLLIGLYSLNKYDNNRRFYSLIKTEPECIHYEITFDGLKKMGLDEKKFQVVNTKSPFAIEGDFCKKHPLYEHFSKVVRSAYSHPWTMGEIDITTFAFFTDSSQANKVKNNHDDYEAYGIGKNWISLCQEVDFLGESSCTVYTLDNADSVINDLLADMRKLILDTNK